MRTDGHIDYSGYSLQQLHEALSLIDGKKYPVNYRNLQSEIASRPAPPATMDAWSGTAAESHSPWRRYRTFWRRLVARLLDNLVLWPVSWVFEFVRTDALSALPLVAWSAFLYAAGPLYNIYFISQHGATIGKMLAGVHVVDLSEERPPSLRQAILRDIGPVIFSCAALAYLVLLLLIDRYAGHDAYTKQLAVPASLLVFAWFPLEFMTIFTNSKRRALHDLIAGTVVVRRA